MNAEEAKQAIKDKTPCHVIDAPARRFILTCLEDEGTGAYYKPAPPLDEWPDNLPYYARGYAQLDKITPAGGNPTP